MLRVNQNQYMKFDKLPKNIVLLVCNYFYFIKSNLILFRYYFSEFLLSTFQPMAVCVDIKKLQINNSCSFSKCCFQFIFLFFFLFCSNPKPLKFILYWNEQLAHGKIDFSCRNENRKEQIIPYAYAYCVLFMKFNEESNHKMNLLLKFLFYQEKGTSI